MHAKIVPRQDCETHRCFLHRPVHRDQQRKVSAVWSKDRTGLVCTCRLRCRTLGILGTGLVPRGMHAFFGLVW
eukprot:4730448-Prymnesium_polylepis.1